MAGFDFSSVGSLLQEAQKKAKELEDKNTSLCFTAKSGGGLVSVSLNGKPEVVDVTIDDSLLEDKDSLQILLIGAINDALRMALENQKNDALSILGDINPFSSR